MKIQTTKIKKDSKAWYRVDAFTGCEFPVKRRITSEVIDGKTVPCKKDIIEGAPIGYLDQYPHCYISEDGKNLTIQETPNQARVYRVGEEMPMHYYSSMCDQLEGIKRVFDLLSADDVSPVNWSGTDEKEIKAKTATKTAVVK